jgi:ABC-type lipoprotein export system ATPase subunit
MTLTVVVGSSGSGKTTFLNDTTKSHHCTYIRQYHNIRPYVTVSQIPNFDPQQLPFWDIYEREKKDTSIEVGGTMAGKFTQGLSGGQRKLLLFELIYQRTANQSDLLLVFDEPFAGVTDDFVPWIVDRLNEMRKKHNILLVTNDHVDALKEMADNTIVVSAIDRTKVRVNDLNNVDRDKCILALSVGDQFHYNSSTADLKFFFDVEVRNNGVILGVAAFTIFAFGLFLASFWNSTESQGALIIVAASLIAHFCLKPYVSGLVDWRNFMSEEAEALMHSSKSTNKILKTFLCLTLIAIVSLVEWGIVNAVVNGFEDRYYWVAILMDSASLIFPFIFFGLYTKLPFQTVQIFSSLPFLFMVFFSTTFSPGAGVEGLKVLRYAFARFYIFCKIPGVMDSMEGCPDEDLNVVYMILAAMVGTFIFTVCQIIMYIMRSSKAKKAMSKQNKMKDDEFRDLQVKLYGEGVLLKDSLSNTDHSHTSKGAKSDKSSNHTTTKDVEESYLQNDVSEAMA